MAKKETETKVEEKTEEAKPESTRGRSIVITDKEGNEVKRADYIRDRYYKDGIERGAIRKELIEKFEHEVAYQIVFAATKTGEKGDAESDPRNKPAEAPAAAEASK